MTVLTQGGLFEDWRAEWSSFEPGTEPLYRYTLERWEVDARGFKPPAVFIMLNPSTATAEKNDPTNTKVMRLTRIWGFAGNVVVNLFAWRATDPEAMKVALDPIGPENDEAILRVTENAGIIVCAWGNDGAHLDRDLAVVKMLKDAGRELHCLGYTKGGHPTHPLARGKWHVPMTVKPIPFIPRA